MAISKVYNEKEKSLLFHFNNILNPEKDIILYTFFPYLKSEYILHDHI